MNDSNSHDLEDYYMQLALLERQKAKRLVMSREHEEMRGHHLTADASRQNDALRDYHMQLASLEELNAKRMMMARQYEDMREHPLIADSPRQNDPRAGKASYRKIDGLSPTPYPIAEQAGSDHVDMINREVPSTSVEATDRLDVCIENNFMSETPGSTSLLVLYKIEGEEETYLLEPSWTTGPPDGFRIKGNSPVANEAEYLRQRPTLDFVVYKHYSRASNPKSTQMVEDEDAALPTLAPVTETIRLLSKEMIIALKMFLNSQPRFKERFPHWSYEEPIKSPFLFWYCYRSTTSFDGLPELPRKKMRLLTDWIDKGYSKIYADAESLFASGFVSTSTMPLLFLPGEVVVSKVGNTTQGYITETPVSKEGVTCRTVSDDAIPTIVKNPFVQRERCILFERWCLKGWSYAFDGCFYRQSSNLCLDLDFSGQKNIKLAELTYLPLRFSSIDVRTKLTHRGTMAWACRHRNLVSHYGEENDFFEREERYMIDFSTYKQQHCESSESKEAYGSFHASARKETNKEVLRCDAPPQFPEVMVFPRTMMGYSFRQNEWQDVEIDMIQNVSWNTQAFDHLVMDKMEKQLLRVLITDNIESKLTADPTQGKGSRPTILLHGGPGTGKTHTAESIAEKVRTPLIRVNCSEIGNEPREVQRHLESAFYLGRVWRCVILLDDADILLEQRAPANIERNALVSVFLHLLRSYTGIVIITTSRVGTIGEAFTSCIQLSLRCETLSTSQRRRIWANLLNQLNLAEQNNNEAQPITDQNERKFVEMRGINLDNIEHHLAELAEEEMNGHQIRNAITTARRIARSEDERMSYKHLKRVIKVSQRFHQSPERARDDGADERMSWEDGRQ